MCCARKPVSTIRNPPPTSTQAPILPELVQEVTNDGAKTEILASPVGRQSYDVGRQKQGMKYSGPITSSIDTNSYQPLSHCYITAHMIKQLCLFIPVISLIP